MTGYFLFKVLLNICDDKKVDILYCVITYRLSYNYELEFLNTTYDLIN